MTALYDGVPNQDSGLPIKPRSGSTRREAPTTRAGSPSVVIARQRHQSCRNPIVMRTLIGLLVGLWLGLLTQSAGAQVSAGCAPGETPRYVFGFADLAAQLGEVMGAPVSCEYADPNGSGDTLQDT